MITIPRFCNKERKYHKLLFSGAMNSPLVSIILSVHNASKYLEACLVSITSQTYKNWELIIVNDGSTDHSEEIITKIISLVSNPVAYIPLDRNRGLTFATNLAINHAKGKYIAKMDADDIMLETRLAEQVSFLEQHPNISVLGSNAIDINESDHEIGVTNVPLEDNTIKKKLFSYYPIIHPTVMIRSSVFSTGIHYRDIYPRAEDYDLWYRLYNAIEFANLEKPLLKKRSHPEQITTSKWGHYDILKLKFDFFLKHRILLKNSPYLLKHLFVVIFLPNSIYIDIKKYIRKKQEHHFKKKHRQLLS